MRREKQEDSIEIVLIFLINDETSYNNNRNILL